MKLTFGWLKEHLDTKATLDDVVDRLTMIGLEVDQVHDRARGLEEFVVGRVVEAKKHPDADKLSVCRVDNGTETVEVVCGAPNARAGMKGEFAGQGTRIPRLLTCSLHFLDNSVLIKTINPWTDGETGLQ